MISCKSPNTKHHLCEVCERAKKVENASNVFVPSIGKDTCNGFIYIPIKKEFLDG